MNKTKALMGTVALAGMVALAGCGGREDEAPPAQEPQAAPAPAETAEPAAAQEPEVEPNGTVIEIQMLTRDPDDPTGMQVFKPRIIEANVGDTIRFVPTDPTHQSSSMEGMIPEGTRGWEGEINQAVEYVVPKPGIYGYQCVPHYAAGMVGIIIVNGEGKLDNLEAARSVRHTGLAQREFAEIFEEAEAQGLLSE